MSGQLTLFSGPPAEPRSGAVDGGGQAGGAETAWPYPAGWSPHELPEPAGEVVQLEPAVARIAAALGRRAGLRYLVAYWAPRLLQGRATGQQQRAVEQAPARPPRGDKPASPHGWTWVETPNPHGDEPYYRLLPATGAGDGKRGAT